MIKIERTSCPEQLDISNKKLVENDYKHPDVLDALLTMQHHKCCYCEKDLNLIGKSAKWVEHFIPRTDNSFKDKDGNVNWNQANDWSNILYTCSTCNNLKGTEKPYDKISGKRRLIDPSYSSINPERHIDFIIKGNAIVYKHRSTLGKNTIFNLQLKGRTDIYSFLRKCKLKIDALFGELVDALVDSKTIMVISKLNDLSKITSASEPHAAFYRKYLLKKIDEFNNIERHLLMKHLQINIDPISIYIASGSEIIY